ncbi:MAG: ABC transporter ATP-binding protein [Defluviitaleaceae bacterium]|nr:ABC transporter ATP-binding protein [Defluviitaleaceae bacterium]
MENIAVSVKDVSMMFNLSRDKVLGFKEYIVKALKRQLYYDEFWALKNISFDVPKGEVLGILGLNGSGKSTLLKLVSGVFKPTKGSITVNGSISPLLELGMGFDPEFSARENVYMNGAMFGHSPSYMDTLYKDIMDFAELWEFADVPIKNFSSGMSARLGFSVATRVNPDILIVDEILGVGDFRFAEKSEVRINELLSGGTTVLLVSHAAETIKKLCTRAMILHQGSMLGFGDVDEICELYQKSGIGS